MIKLIKHILIVCLVMVAIIGGLFFTIHIINNNNKVLKMSNAIKDLLNNGIKTEYFDEKDYCYIEYAKKKDVNYYDITDFVNNYFDIINKSIMFKKSESQEPKYVYYEHKTDNQNNILIFGLNENKAQYIQDNITDEDILDYDANLLIEKLSQKLMNYFKNDSGKWYIDGNEDKHIELPYNVYVDYVSDKKETKNNIKEFLEIKLSSSDINKLTNKKTVVNMHYKYETINGEIVNGDMLIGAKIDKNYSIKFDANYLTGFYSTLGNYATLTAGQHDYDEARERERELDTYSPLTNEWEETTEYKVNVVSVEEIQKKYRSFERTNKNAKRTRLDSTRRIILSNMVNKKGGIKRRWIKNTRYVNRIVSDSGSKTINEYIEYYNEK